jgi:hypothetical protein
MSVATITPIVTSRAGSDFTTASQAATGGGDFWAGTGAEWLVVNNGGGSPITVTLVHQGTIDGQSLTNLTVSVTNAHTEIIGPFPVGLYNDGSGNVNVTYSAVTSVKVAVYKLGT